MIAETGLRDAIKCTSRRSVDANGIITPTKVKGSPQHLVEILSPSTASKDRALKRSLYERAGVTEYWIVDPFKQELTQLVLVEGAAKNGPVKER